MIPGAGIERTGCRAALGRRGSRLVQRTLHYAWSSDTLAREARKFARSATRQE